MPFLRRLRLIAGVLLYDRPAFERLLRAEGKAGCPEPWLLIRNRRERVQCDSRGVRCDWRFTSELHIANVFPSAGARLMRRAFDRWPVRMQSAPENGAAAPDVSFVIGHRGADRLPHLLQTLRSIAGQQGAVIECVVVEQSASIEVRDRLPRWVRYVHTPVAPDFPYSRSWAFNVGANVARGAVLIFHDNDLIAPSAYAAEALARVLEGWRFVDLKRFIFYLSETESNRLFSGEELRTDVSSPVVQNAQGGTIAIERGRFHAIGGFDESFVGWGGEDNDFRERADVPGGVYGFGYLPFLHMHHASQAGKTSGGSAAVARYQILKDVPPGERIEALLRREKGRLEGPSTGDPDVSG